MKILDIIRDANANLFRNKLRSFLTILAIFIGSFAIITNTAIQAGVNRFIDDQVDSYGGEGYIAIANKDTLDVMLNSTMRSSKEPQEYSADQNQTSATPIKKEQLEKLKKLDVIKDGEVYQAKNLTVDYIASDKTDKKYLLTAEAIPAGEIHVESTAGVSPDNDNLDEDQIMITQSLVSVLGFESDEAAVGQIVKLGVVDSYTRQTTEFEAKVVGVIAPGVVTLGYNYLNNSLADKIYNENTKYYPAEEKDKVYAVTATYDYANYSKEEVQDALEEIGLGGMTLDDIIGTIKSFFDIMTGVLTIFGAIALAAAAIGIINTLFMSVQERTREIGLDKALGMSSRHVFLSFSIEAIFLGFWGSVVGIILSMIAGNAMNVAFHAEGGLLEAFPTFNLVQYPIENIISITIIVMIIAFLAGTIPARSAARKDPIDALRYE